MQLYLGNLLSDAPQRRHMIFMRMRDKEVLQLKLILLDQRENRGGIEAGIEQCRFARDFVPDEIAMDTVARPSGGNLPELAPEAQIRLCGQPPVRQPFQFVRMQAEERGQRSEIQFGRKTPRILK